jgi:hypothetical protein
MATDRSSMQMLHISKVNLVKTNQTAKLSFDTPPLPSTRERSKTASKMDMVCLMTM